MSTFRCRWFAAAGAIVAASVTYAVHAQPRTLADQCALETIRPQQRSYLDAGPAPARQSGPGYLRDNGTSFATRSDSFGSGVLPSF